MSSAAYARAAYAIGRAEVPGAHKTGGDREALLAIIRDDLMASGNGARVILNHVIATGVSNGALALYQAEGTEWVDVMVSPNACAICEPFPTGGPYRLTDAPEVPAYINCRCSYTPASPPAAVRLATF